VDQPGPTGGGLGSTTPVRPDDARWGGAEVQAPSFSPQQAGVRESVGASPRGPDFQSASAQTERSIHTAIRPDLAETHSYKQLLTNGEIGLERPQGANVPGRPDSVTARENADGSITVFVNDAKGSKSGNFPEPAPHMPSTWRQQVENAVAPGRLDLGDPALEARIQQAVAQGNIELRQLNVDWSTPNVTVTDPVTGQRF
jgi:hypothetical protein